MRYAIGIDLGGSSVKAVAVTPEGATLRQANVDFDPAADREWALRIKELVQRFRSELGENPLGEIAPCPPEPSVGSSRREEAQTMAPKEDQSLVTSAATVQEFKARILSGNSLPDRGTEQGEGPAGDREIHGEEGGPIGLSAPGLVAKDGRSVAYLPNRLPGIEGFDWTAFLQSRRPVPVLNDAHAALLGEVWLGAARGFRNVILLTLGTGVGGAAMVDGKLLRGHTGKAGHLGHICLDPDGALDICNTPGSLELAIGNCTIQERSQGRFQTTHDLIEAHRAGDAEATRVWLKSVKALACGIGSLTNVLDPEAVIIGGGVARAGEALFEPLRKMVSDAEWKVCGHDVKILSAQLGELAGAYGAAFNAVRVAEKMDRT